MLHSKDSIIVRRIPNKTVRVGVEHRWRRMEQPTCQYCWRKMTATLLRLPARRMRVCPVGSHAMLKHSAHALQSPRRKASKPPRKTCIQNRRLAGRARRKEFEGRRAPSRPRTIERRHSSINDNRGAENKPKLPGPSPMICEPLIRSMNSFSLGSRTRSVGGICRASPLALR
jgi:hypothetical protein